MSQVATPELQQWIVEQARAGCKPEAVLSAMTQAGWKEDVAIAAMEATLGEHLAGLPKAAAPQAPARAKRLPEPQMAGHPRQVDAGDRVVDVLVNMLSPRVVVFGNLLSAEECEALIADVRVFDVYRGKGVDDGFKSVALEVVIQPREATLTEAEIEEITRAPALPSVTTSAGASTVTLSTDMRRRL